MSEESIPLSLRNTATEAEMDELIGEKNEIAAPHDTSRPRIHNGQDKGGKKLAFLSDIQQEKKPEFKWSVVPPALEGIQEVILNEGADQVGLITGTPTANFGSVISCGFDSTFPTNSYFTLSFEILPTIVVMIQLVEGDFNDFSLSGSGPANFFMMVQGGNVILTSSHADIEPLNLTNTVTTGVQEFGFERVANEWFLHFQGARKKVHIGGDRDPIAAIIIGSIDGSKQTIRTNASAAVPATANGLVVSLSDSESTKLSSIVKPLIAIKTNSEYLTSEKDKDGNISLVYSPYSTSINTITPSTVNYAVTKDSIVAGKDPLIKMSTSFPNVDSGTVRTITIPSESSLEEIKSIGSIYGMSNRGQKDGVIFEAGPGVQIIHQASIKDQGILVALKTEPNKWFIHKIQNVREVNRAISSQVTHASNMKVLYSGGDIAKISDDYHLTLNEYFQIQSGETFGMPSAYTVTDTADGYHISNFYKRLGSLKRKILTVTASFYGATRESKFFLSTSRSNDHLAIRCVDENGARLNSVLDIHSRIVER